MSQSDWRQHLANNQYDLLPFLIGSIFGVLALTGLRDFIRMPDELSALWYIYIAAALLLEILVLALRSADLFKPASANTVALVCALPVLFYPVMEIVTGNMGGLLYLPIALLGAGFAVNSMAHLLVAHAITIGAWITAISFSTLEINFVPTLALNGFAIVLGALILHRKIRSFRHVFELENRVSALESFLPICSGCKKTRDQSGSWIEIESYLKQKEEGLQLTHGMCPDCRQDLFAK